MSNVVVHRRKSLQIEFLVTSPQQASREGYLVVIRVREIVQDSQDVRQSSLKPIFHIEYLAYIYNISYVIYILF